MKSLEEIKEEYAKSHAFNDWKTMYSYLGVLQRQLAMDEISRRYAKEVAKESLKNASKNAKCTFVRERINDSDGQSEVIVQLVDKESILNESNIPNLD